MEVLTRVFSCPLDVNYAASKTSATANTALYPYDLAEGAIGIYGVHKGNAGNNKDKTVLIRDAGSESNGVVPAATFLSAGGTEVSIFLGTADGAIKQGVMDLANLTCVSQAYVAPVKGATSYGWSPNNTGGDLNLPATILRGDEAVLKVIPIKDASENDRTGKSYSGYAGSDGDSTYNILADLIINSINEDEDRLIEADIYASGTITELTATTDATVTNGSAIVTLSANETIATGAFVSIRNRIYQVAVGVTAGTEITLDRPYTGATETIDTDATTDQFGTIASVTAYGLLIEEKEEDTPVALAVDELLRSASKYTETAYVEGIGTGAKVLKEEQDALPTFGAHDSRMSNRVVPSKQAVTDVTKNYDQYYLKAINTRTASDPHTANYKSSSSSELLVAFDESLADTTGKNQSDFEDILTALGVTVATLF